MDEKLFDLTVVQIEPSRRGDYGERVSMPRDQHAELCHEIDARLDAAAAELAARDAEIAALKSTIETQGEHHGEQYQKICRYAADLKERHAREIASLAELRERNAELEARVNELEADGCWLAERCAACGHRFAYPSNFCARCAKTVGPTEPDEYPELCECPRCIVARNVAIDAATARSEGE